MTAPNLEKKRVWCEQLKRLMMENHHKPVPKEAKSKILNSEYYVFNIVINLNKSIKFPKK